MMLVMIGVNSSTHSLVKYVGNGSSSDNTLDECMIISRTISSESEVNKYQLASGGQFLVLVQI